MHYLMKYLSPIGKMTLASDGKNLVGLWLAGQKYERLTLADTHEENHEIEVLKQTSDWLDRYFAGQRPDPKALPLAPSGSAFRQSVWQLLQEIPYGEVLTYGEIAAKIAAQRQLPRMSSQAIGGAVGHNPISVIIPCHRVVGANGSLTGFASGISAKLKLLTLEEAPVDTLFIPEKGTAL